MKTELIRIGNSRGVRIPKLLIEQVGLGHRVELWAESDRVVIAPQRRPRQGWEESFAVAGSPAKDELLLEDSGVNSFDVKDWNW